MFCMKFPTTEASDSELSLEFRVEGFRAISIPRLAFMLAVESPGSLLLLLLLLLLLFLLLMERSARVNDAAMGEISIESLRRVPTATGILGSLFKSSSPMLPLLLEELDLWPPDDRDAEDEALPSRSLSRSLDDDDDFFDFLPPPPLPPVRDWELDGLEEPLFLRCSGTEVRDLAADDLEDPFFLVAAD
jgi:hypothetical protein